MDGQLYCGPGECFHDCIGIGEQVSEDGNVDLTTVSGVTFSNVVLDIPSGSVLEDHVNGPVPAGVTSGSTASGQADVSAFDGWSWAAQAGATSGL
ncbi:MAG: hypothetical protein U5L96_19350 [Owenweeksia sp.]|nr:hypothetical protein [Owenweeksia sp.]